MTEKRFTLKAYDGITCDIFDGKIEIANVHRDDAQGLCDLLNKQHEQIQQQKQQIQTLQNYSDRRREENIRLRKDFDKLYEICKDKGMTDDEILKELYR